MFRSLMIAFDELGTPVRKERAIGLHVTCVGHRARVPLFSVAVKNRRDRCTAWQMPCCYNCTVDVDYTSCSISRAICLASHACLVLNYLSHVMIVFH